MSGKIFGKARQLKYVNLYQRRSRFGFVGRILSSSAEEEGAEAGVQRSSGEEGVDLGSFSVLDGAWAAFWLRGS